MIVISFSANYQFNSDHHDWSKYPIACLICGKGMSPEKARHWVHVFYGSTIVTPQEAKEILAKEGGGGDLGVWPIGADCLRKHPELKPYLLPDQ